MWLDSGEPPAVEGIELEAVEGQWQKAGPYRPEPDEVEAVRGVTADMVDVVVIGTAAGMEKEFAEALPKELRGRAVVVWYNVMREADRLQRERRVRQFGIRHFCKEDELEGKLIEMSRMSS